MASRAASIPQSPPIPAGLTRDQLLEIYRYLRLTRTLEERLTALYRQTKVIGGLFRSLGQEGESEQDRKSTRLNSSHGYISYAVFCLKKKKKKKNNNLHNI